MNKRGILSMFLAVAMAGSLAAGCTRTSGSGSAASAGSNQKATLRFMWWGSDGRHKATLDAISAYEKLHPNVTISGEYSGYSGYQQKLTTQLTSGTAPDIMQIDVMWIGSYAAEGNLFADLSKQKAIDTSHFSSKFLKSYCQIGGKLQGLPSGEGCNAILYNTELFQTLGLSATTPFTWDSFLSIGESVHQKDSGKYFLLPGTENARVLLRNYIEQKTGKPFIDEKGNITVDKATLTDAFAYFRKLLDNGVYAPFKTSAAFDSNPESNPEWVNGNIAADYGVLSTFSSNSGTVKFTMGITDIPMAQDAKGVAGVSPSQILSINAKSKSLSAAARFLNWFLNDTGAAEILTDQRGVPPTDVARNLLVKAGKLNPSENKVLENAQAKPAVVETTYSNNSEIIQLTNNIVQNMAYNGESADAAAAEFLNSLKTKVEEIKNAA